MKAGRGHEAEVQGDFSFMSSDVLLELCSTNTESTNFAIP